MNNKSIPYLGTRPLQLNVYLLFYVYVFGILIIANVLPAWSVKYFLFLFFGVTGIIILVVQFTYSISIKENTIQLSIKIPFKVILLKLNIENVEDIEETKIDFVTYVYSPHISKRGNIVYFFGKEKGIKLTMRSGKVFIISGIDADQVINRIKSYKREIQNSDKK